MKALGPVHTRLHHVIKGRHAWPPSGLSSATPQRGEIFEQIQNYRSVVSVLMKYSVVVNFLLMKSVERRWIYFVCSQAVRRLGSSALRAA